MKKKILTLLGILILMIIVVPQNIKAETYEYDDLNRVIKVIYDDGSYVEYEYDRNGNIVNIKVHEAETTKKPQETTEKQQETTKVEQETTKKEQETTKKPQETTKKPQETTKKEQETTKKPQETTKRPQETTKKEQETTKKPQETTKKTQKPNQPEEEETTKPGQITNPSINGSQPGGMIPPPALERQPGSHAFDEIINILNSYDGAIQLGQHNNGDISSAGTDSGTGVTGGNSIKDGQGDYGMGFQPYNPELIGQKLEEITNKTAPEIAEYVCEFVIGIIRIYIGLGR